MKLESLYGLSGGIKPTRRLTTMLGLPQAQLPERSKARLRNSAAKRRWREGQKGKGEWVK